MPEHVQENIRYWDAYAPQWVAGGEAAWASPEPYWGCWQQRDLGLLPPSMEGLRAIELGCGTGYVSAWMARRGATVVAVDTSEAQLATARRLAADHALPISFLHASAEAVPAPAASFDFAISEYGAAIWCRPEAWLAEAHRLLRPGGRLVFLGNHPLVAACSPLDGRPAEAQLHRDYFGLDVLDWRDVAEDPGGIEFTRPISGWMRLLRELGFDIEDFLELQAPEGAEDRFSVPAAWAQRFPAEQVWFLRKR